MPRDDAVDLEVELLLEAIKRRRGYDFTGYAAGSLRRRLHAVAQRAGVPHIAALIEPVLHDDGFFASFLREVFVSVSSMFRDPDFFLALRTEVCPLLATHPRPKIWHAGCATGEEVYSLAIVLHEEGLLGRTHIYATDVNLGALSNAIAGVYRRERLDEAEEAYRTAGGRARLADYYVAHPGRGRPEALALMGRELRDRVTWSQHDLCRDPVFSEVHLVLCRNTLIYFAPELQGRVLGTLHRSLSATGLLALGRNETIERPSGVPLFEPLDPELRIYRRLPGNRLQDCRAPRPTP